METMEHAKTRVLIMIDQIVSSQCPATEVALAHKANFITAQTLRRYHEA
jgi:hypothetical protein